MLAGSCWQQSVWLLLLPFIRLRRKKKPSYPFETMVISEGHHHLSLTNKALLLR